jgi:hypothetical protein
MQNPLFHAREGRFDDQTLSRLDARLEVIAVEQLATRATMHPTLGNCEIYDGAARLTPKEPCLPHVICATPQRGSAQRTYAERLSTRRDRRVVDGGGLETTV